MSKYTTRQVLDMIEANGGPEGLDLSGEDLRGINLSRDTIQAELKRIREEDSSAKPVWVSDLTNGINLEEADLQKADLGGANLQEASLWSADLQGANLREADLQEADLSRAHNLEFALLGRQPLDTQSSTITTARIVVGLSLFGVKRHDVVVTLIQIFGELIQIF